MRRVFLPTAAALVLLAGCGGDGGGPLSKADYQTELERATTAVEQAFTKLSESLQNVSEEKGSLEDAADEVTNIQDELRSAADGLDDVEPPENVSEAHDTLIDGMRRLADDLDEMKTALEEGDAGKLQEISSGFENLESSKLLERATNDLEAAGYKLGSDSE
jgi:multidrug resistance efflux pump